MSKIVVRADTGEEVRKGESIVNAYNKEARFTFLGVTVNGKIWARSEGPVAQKTSIMIGGRYEGEYELRCFPGLQIADA